MMSLNQDNRASGQPSNAGWEERVRLSQFAGQTVRMVALGVCPPSISSRHRACVAWIFHHQWTDDQGEGNVALLARSDCSLIAGLLQQIEKENSLAGVLPAVRFQPALDGVVYEFEIGHTFAPAKPLPKPHLDTRSNGFRDDSPIRLKLLSPAPNLSTRLS